MNKKFSLKKYKRQINDEKVLLIFLSYTHCSPHIIMYTPTHLISFFSPPGNKENKYI